jgi:hypothetical protein
MPVNEAKNIDDAVVDRKTGQGMKPREWKLSSPVINQMVAREKNRGTQFRMYNSGGRVLHTLPDSLDAATGATVSFDLRRSATRSGV